jgi:hypothetical protein
MKWLTLIFWAYVTQNGHCEFQEVGMATDNHGQVVIVIDSLNVRMVRQGDYKAGINLMKADSVFYSYQGSTSKGGFLFFVIELEQLPGDKFKGVNSFVISSCGCPQQNLPNGKEY